MDKELLTAQQAASYLNVSVKTIRRWAQQHRLIGLKVGPRGDWRFTKADLQKMVQKND